MTVIELSDASRYFDKLGNDMREAAIRGIRSAATRGVAIIQTQIVPSRSPQPVDRGTYRAGWQADLTDPPDGATILNAEPHAVFIEDGVRPDAVRPSRAMLQNLMEWAYRKGLAGDDKEALSVAWAIANTARLRGFFKTTGLGILRELVDEHLPRILEEEVTREIQRVTR